MKTILRSTFISIFLVSTGGGCGKKAPACDELFDHTLSLMPAEVRDKAASNKSDAIAKCEKMSAEARQCAFEAKTLEALMKCPKQ